MKFTKRAMVHSKETRESQKEFWDEADAAFVSSPLYACMLAFRRTLEIITCTLREMVNRVRLCGHHSPFEVFTWWSACVPCLYSWLLGCGNSVALWRSSRALSSQNSFWDSLVSFEWTMALLVNFIEFSGFRFFLFFWIFWDSEKSWHLAQIFLVCCKDLRWHSLMDQGTYRFEH